MAQTWTSHRSATQQALAIISLINNNSFRIWTLRINHIKITRASRATKIFSMLLWMDREAKVAKIQNMIRTRAEASKVREQVRVNRLLKMMMMRSLLIKWWKSWRDRRFSNKTSCIWLCCKTRLSKLKNLQTLDIGIRVVKKRERVVPILSQDNQKNKQGIILMEELGQGGRAHRLLRTEAYNFKLKLSIAKGLISFKTNNSKKF